MAQRNFKNTKVYVDFDEASSRQQLNSGDNISTLFGKIKKIFSDLKSVCFTGSYKDLSDTPTTATKDTDGLMSAEDKTKLDGADDTYALKSLYGDTTINVGRKAGTPVGVYSVAEGDNTTASGKNSHAGGSGTKALHDNEVAYGKYNESNDNTLFSIGDGTAEDARHNAFEITNTGGKLHDKDIATTDLIPTELPANGGNADTVNNKQIQFSIYNEPSEFGCTGTETADVIWESIPAKSIFICSVTSLTDTSWNFPNNVISTGYVISITKISTRRIGGMYLYPKMRGNIYCGAVNNDGTFSGTWWNIADKGNTSEIAGHPNLLTNPDFAINQRGNTSTTINSSTWVNYFIADRWKLYINNTSPEGTINRNSDGTITLAMTTAYCDIRQIFESAVKPGYYTISAKINGEIRTLSGYKDSTGELLDHNVGLVIGNNFCGVRCYPGQSITIEWVKLEQGTTPTNFVTPNIADEMTKCLRYYEKIEYPTSSGLTAIQWKNDLNNCCANIPFFTKRINSPTVTFSGGSSWRFVSNNGAGAITGGTVQSITSKNIGALFALASATTTPSFGWVDRFSVTIDAEL